MVDIPGVVQSIRQQRMKMVQTVVCNVFIVPLIEKLLQLGSSYILHIRSVYIFSKKMY